jgi:DNA-binding beta-propeller fold protein YncE
MVRLLLPAALLLAGCGAGSSAVQAEDGKTLFVANKREASLSRIDLASGEETARAETCENPHELAISPDGRHVLAACYSGTALEIYSAADLSPAGRIELGAAARPHSAAWHSNGMIVAGAEGRGSIFVVRDPLSGAPQLTEIGKGEVGPHMVVIDEAGENAWGTIIPAGTVVRYDLAKGEVAARKRLGGRTEAIALAPGGGSLWIGDNDGAKVYRLNPQTLEVEAEVVTGPVPIRVLAHPGGDYVVTSNFGGGSVSVIDAASNSVVREILVSGGQAAVQVTLLFGDDGSRLYVAETATNTVAEVDFASGEVLRRLPAGEGGDGLAIKE